MLQSDRASVFAPNIRVRSLGDAAFSLEKLKRSQKELVALRRQLARLTAERDLLKKAQAYFVTTAGGRSLSLQSIEGYGR